MVRVPACIFREDVKITKPLTLVGSPGAEIRGSDVWAGWQRHGSYWISALTVPLFHTQQWECNSGTERCRWPEQVFVNGRARVQVASGTLPRRGEFALDSARHVVLADDPARQVVEVTTRQEILWAGASDVTVSGLTMRHAAAPAGSGAVQVGGYWVGAVDRFVLRNSVVSDVHGDVISLQGGTGHVIVNNDISRGGRTGITGSGGSSWTIAGNRVHDNATEGFDLGSHSGGMKFLDVDGLVVNGNEVDHNASRGIWTDTGTHNVTISNNRLHHNRNNGLFLESSHQLDVFGNKVWENAHADHPWAWGGGITLSSSDHANVHDNVVAWNAQGITVISQARGDDAPHVDISIHDNVVIQSGHALGIGWMMDWPGILFDASSGNGGADNGYWFPAGRSLFAWSRTYVSLAEYNQTPGEENGRYLTTVERREVLSKAGMPLTHE